MDPITQGALGAVAAASAAPSCHARLATLAGWVGGMAADLDVFIRSDDDPLLHLEYHRHFTHALAFIPLGGLLCAAFLFPFLRKRLSFARLYGYATAGYATAGLLDACTSYGTQLLWPFSDARISWNIVSVVDPLYTAPLLACLLLAWFRRKPRWARGAALFSLAYLSLGLLQRERAEAVQNELAAERGHTPTSEATVKPSIANLILWRSIYAHDGVYYVDAIRVPPFFEPQVYPGESAPKLRVELLLAQLPEHSPLAHDLRRFNHFSEGYLARLPDQPEFITDLRYSAVPHQLDPLWGIDLPDESDPSKRVEFITRRSLDQSKRRDFLAMLLGQPLQSAAPQAGACEAPQEQRSVP